MPFAALLLPGAVFFVGVFLVAWSQASSSTTRPHAVASGFLQGITWVTDLLGQAWHRLVRGTISRFAVSHLVPLVRWFGAMNGLVLAAVYSYRATCEATAAAIEHLSGHVIPREVRKGNAAAKATAQRAQKTAAQARAQAQGT